MITGGRAGEMAVKDFQGSFESDAVISGLCGGHGSGMIGSNREAKHWRDI
jgi:hypothetical protein